MSTSDREDAWTRLAPAPTTTPTTEADFAALRTLGRTTVGKSFVLSFGHPDNVGQHARTVWQVITEDSNYEPSNTDLGEEVPIHTSPAGRIQIKARVVREPGNVIEIRFEKLTSYPSRGAELESLVKLDADASRRLIDLCLALRGIDPRSDETIRLDERTLATILEHPDTLATAYGLDRERYAAIIKSDASAQDVIALAGRKAAIERFEELLYDTSVFESARDGGTKEGVWQNFFEANPWLLGVGLSGQLLTSWDEHKLERVVAGHSVADTGKRVDALLTTSGIIKSLVFAELKLHNDDLLDTSSYRPGTWAPSKALAGGISQSLVTSQRARDDLGSWLRERDEEGYETGTQVYSGAPRSFLVIGTLDSLIKDGQMQTDKVRSFELYRRNMHMPDIVTYDEVLARAKWTVESNQLNDIAGDPQ
ncbi:Shedu immune nuclease family protein [Clavibacter michiganensis]|uniref:Shedu immune nuclease family protein n=1 Tax=Clavibacter michiganensis TaxID=28447 RepID=UPI001BDFD5FE|nr:Shedu immune nuclease family protein [Clavibacter michiganensis]MBT1635435.1 DUF4263 domain-containing protein [Clavibacter michiganensis]